MQIVSPCLASVWPPASRARTGQFFGRQCRAASLSLIGAISSWWPMAAWRLHIVWASCLVLVRNPLYLRLCRKMILNLSLPPQFRAKAHRSGPSNSLRSRTCRSWVFSLLFLLFGALWPGSVNPALSGRRSSSSKHPTPQSGCGAFSAFSHRCSRPMAGICRQIASAPPGDVLVLRPSRC